ncbi:alpha/beta hydrolase family esterase [Schlesneria paludicola]|uniref:alpha/beta hydrolase family esterase n=1 Tax=Schlesneria paludicola TaxID=360056 RepID=UPI00029AA0A3|nr:PHB depolymerase family esterase [Schlesneria paludicola]
MSKSLFLLGLIVVSFIAFRSYLRAQSPRAKQSDFSHSLNHDGRTRTYEVHLPSQYDAKTPLPVVVNLHGGGGNATAHRKQTQMDACADKNGFLVVYPEGTSGGGRFYTWNAGLCCAYAVKWKIDDVGFLDKLLDDLPKQYAVDTRRIYLTGMSNGSMMAYRYACERPQRVTALCGVATTLGVDGPMPTRPVPLMHIHGLLDPNAPFAGGVGPNAFSKINHRAVKDVISWWCGVNHCAVKPSLTEDQPDFLHEHFSPPEGQTGAPIELYMLREGGHTWPGGIDVTPRLGTGKLITNFDANTRMWNFFKQFTLDQPGSM